MELSIVQLLMKNSQIRQFKYFKVLVQEFHIKVDLGFVNAIVEIFAESEQSDEEEVSWFLTVEFCYVHNNVTHFLFV